MIKMLKNRQFLVKERKETLEVGYAGLLGNKTASFTSDIPRTD